VADPAECLISDSETIQFGFLNQPKTVVKNMKPKIADSFFPIGLLTLILVTSGCQSGKWTRPDFSSLAFWKKDRMNLSSRMDDELPPPSTHFDPEPKQQVAESSAEKKAAAGQTDADLRDKITKILKDAKQEKDEAVATGDPSGLIRKPYNLESIDGNLASGDNSFDVAQGKSTSPAADGQKQIAGWRNDVTTGRDRPTNTSAPTEAVAASQNELKNLKRSLENQAGELVENSSRMAGEMVQSATDFGNDFAVNAKNQAIDLAQKSSQKIAERAQAAATAVQNEADNSFQAISTAANEFGASIKNPFVAHQNNPTDVTLSEKTPATKSSPSDSSVKSAEHSANVEKDFPDGRTDLAKANTFDSETPQNAQHNNRYPSTPFGEIKPNPKKKVSDYSKKIDTIESPDSGIVTAGGTDSTSRRFQQTTGTLEIPHQLLHGNSSFAPGSTKQLNPIRDDWQPDEFAPSR
jgi:hypothetical protein